MQSKYGDLKAKAECTWGYIDLDVTLQFEDSQGNIVLDLDLSADEAKKLAGQLLRSAEYAERLEQGVGIS